MKKHNLFSLIIGTFILFSLMGCKTEEKAVTKVVPIDTTKYYGSEGFLYSLPETNLYFDIELIRETKVPGPYHSYGEQLLGVSGIPHEQIVSWQIQNISIHPREDIDYEHLYIVKPEGTFSIAQNNLTRKGWIIPLTNNMKPTTQEDFYPRQNEKEGVLFKDLSVRKFVGEETKTVYQRVWKDSLYAQVPVKESYMVSKTEKEKAQEAAAFVFMIREKRFELLAGMSDFYPDGEALKTAVQKLDRLEDTYISLFTGKSFKDTINYTLYLNPTQKHLLEPHILFRFSEQEGVMKSTANKGVPVWIEFNKLENTRVLDKYFQDHQISTSHDQFYYRFPAKSEIRLKYADETISRKFLDIFQYGPVIKVPVQYLNDQEILHHYPEEEK